MSEWYTPDNDDITIDHKSREVDIFVHSNDYGNVYVSLKFDQVKDILKKIWTEL